MLHVSLCITRDQLQLRLSKFYHILFQCIHACIHIIAMFVSSSYKFESKACERFSREPEGTDFTVVQLAK